MARRHWTCRKCSYRNERSSSRKCSGCGELTKPKLRVPKHAETLRDDPYELYEELSARIHNTDLGACGCCRRGRVDTRRHDRDHDHYTGKPRGLACTRCNKELLRNATLESARAVVAYLERVESYYETPATT